MTAPGFVLMLCFAVSPVGTPASGPPLDAHSRVDEELAGGGERVHPLAVHPGEFVRVGVLPTGLDLTVALERDGVVVVRDAGWDVMPRTVSAVAEDGQWRLRIRSTDKPERRGRYRIDVRAWRTAEAADAERVRADIVFAQGVAALRANSEPLRQAALGHFLAARDVWKALGDPDEAEALSMAGETSYALGDIEGARAWFLEELPKRRARGDTRGEGMALNNLAVTYSVAGRAPEALLHYEQALALQRAAGDTRAEALALSNIGVVASLLGDYQKASDAFTAALPLRRAAGDRRGEAHTLHSLGAVHFSFGAFDEALAYGKQALALWREIGDRGGEAQTLQGIGLLYAERGDPERARAFLETAVAYQREIGDRLWEAMAVQDLGTAYAASDPARALGYFGDALALHRAVGRPLGEADTLLAMGEAHARLGDPVQARQRLDEALALYRQIGDAPGEANTLFALGRLARDGGRLDEARGLMEGSLAIIDAQRARVVRPDQRVSFASRRQDQYEDHVDLLIDLHRRDAERVPASAAFAAAEHARARMLRDLMAESDADVRAGLDPVLAARLRGAQDELNSRERERLRLVRAGAPAETREAAAVAVAAALERYRETEGEARAANPRLAALTQPPPVNAAALQSLLDSDTVLLEFALGRRRSHLFVVTPHSVVAYELPPRAAIEERARRFQERLRAGERREARAAIGLAGRELSDLLLGAAARWIAGRRIAVVPDGALHAIPFAALPAPGSDAALLFAHEIVQLPSLAVLQSLREEGGRSVSGLHAVVADPVFDESDSRLSRAKRVARGPASPADVRGLAGPVMRSLEESGLPLLVRLPHTRREADAIRELAGADRTRLALGFDATRESVTGGSLEDAAVVHFATHGILNGRHPELSGLVLSLYDREGRPQDGFLRLHDVYNLELDAGLVVLSACRTAMGPDVRGEGVVGLTRGFMYAGAPRVVASLWDVRDDAAAELMRRFYAGMRRRGLRPAAALRDAQLSLAREPRWSSPFHWAAFVLQGDWR